MPRQPPEWATDEEFCAIATIAWAEDYATATKKSDAAAHQRNTARQKMRHRYEGFRFAEVLAERVEDMRAAVDALSSRMLGVMDHVEKLK